jgi:hypothetical protein
MQTTADFHHHVAYPRFPQPDRLFEHPATFDTAVDMFDAHASPRDLTVSLFLLRRQLLPARLFRRLDNFHALQRERLTAHILQEVTPRRKRIRRRVRNALVMDTALMGRTQEQNAQRGVDQQDVFQHVSLFLAAITRFLFSRIVGARNGALGAVMTKRGAAVGVAAWPSSSGDTSNGRGGPSIPRRSRKASIVRQGASPKRRSVLRNTGSKT